MSAFYNNELFKSFKSLTTHSFTIYIANLTVVILVYEFLSEDCARFLFYILYVLYFILYMKLIVIKTHSSLLSSSIAALTFSN